MQGERDFSCKDTSAELGRRHRRSGTWNNDQTVRFSLLIQLLLFHHQPRPLELSIYHDHLLSQTSLQKMMFQTRDDKRDPEDPDNLRLHGFWASTDQKAWRSHHRSSSATLSCDQVCDRDRESSLLASSPIKAA